MPLPTALAGDLSAFVDAIWSAGTALTETARRRRYAQARDGADIAIATGEDAVALAAPAWRSIEEAGGAATPFQTLAMAQQAAEVHLRRGETPRIVVVRDGGRPAVIFPTVLGRQNAIPTIRFLGDPLIQYGDVVTAPDAAPALIEQAWHAATASSGASLVYLRKVRADARIAAVLARRAHVMAEYEAPFVDVRQPPASSSHYRRDLRRLRRRLAEVGELRFETLCGSAARRSVEEALRIKRDWLDARCMPSSVIGDRDWEAAIVALASDRNSGLHAARLTVDGRPAAIEIGFVHGERWYAFLGALAPDFAKAGPGHVQMEETLDHCRNTGLAAYDLLPPADAYKRLVAHGTVTVRDHAAAIGPAGWLGLFAARARPVAKRMFASLPPHLRRALIGKSGK